jgi:hypothetical protein
VAAEVTNLQISYFAGSNWNDSWDGSTIGADNVTPIGPPVAIELVVTIKGADGKEVTYNHVVAFNAAPGNPTNVTSSSGSSGSGSP